MEKVIILVDGGVAEVYHKSENVHVEILDCDDLREAGLTDYEIDAVLKSREKSD